jgi:hypothetical protein
MASLRGGMRAGGERLGVLPALPLDVIRWIIAERAKGLIFQAIADGLMEGRIVTSRGRQPGIQRQSRRGRSERLCRRVPQRGQVAR